MQKIYLVALCELFEFCAEHSWCGTWWCETINKSAREQNEMLAEGQVSLPDTLPLHLPLQYSALFFLHCQLFTQSCSSAMPDLSLIYHPFKSHTKPNVFSVLHLLAMLLMLRVCVTEFG